MKKLYLNLLKNSSVLKCMITLSVFFLCCNCMAQPFLGLQAYKNGAGIQGGYQFKLDPENKTISANSILVTIGDNFSVINSEKKAVPYVTGGYVHSFSEEDAITISASVGSSFHKYEKLNQSPDPKVLKETMATGIKFIPYYNLELGKDFYMGRLFVNASYNQHILLGVGFKAFLN